jgi:hypothetical protein
MSVKHAVRREPVKLTGDASPAHAVEKPFLPWMRWDAAVFARNRSG